MVLAVMKRGLALIAKTSEPEDCANHVEYLPLR